MILNVNLKWQGDPFRKAKFARAQRYIDETCVEKMEKYVPVAPPFFEKSGSLRDSAKISEPGHIVYTADFAPNTYYGTYKHKKSGNPDAKRLWFEVMKTKHKDEILKGAAKKLT